MEGSEIGKAGLVGLMFLAMLSMASAAIVFNSSEAVNLNISSQQEYSFNNTTFDVNSNNISNFFGSDCGANKVVRSVYPNGSYNCVDVSSVSSAENLSETLAQGNSTGSYSIDLNDNNLTDVDSVFVQRKIDMGSNVDIEDYFAPKCPTNYGINQIYPNGSYSCVTSLVPGDYPVNLSTVLDQNNSAGNYNIDMANESIIGVDSIQIGLAPEYGTLEVDEIGVDRDDVRLSSPGYLRTEFASGMQFYDSGNSVATLSASALSLNSSIELENGAELTSQGQDLTINAGSNDVNLTGQSINLSNSNITDYYDGDCGTNKTVQGVYPNGTFKCIDIQVASGTEDLETTLSTGNTAGSNQINMTDNKIVGLADPVNPQDAVNKRFLTDETANSTDVSNDGVTIVNSTLDINFGSGIDAAADGDRSATISVNTSDIESNADLNETLSNGNSAGNNSIDMNGNNIKMNGGNVTAGNAEEFCIGYCGG